jgi:hypothetical protein
LCEALSLPSSVLGPVDRAHGRHGDLHEHGRKALIRPLVIVQSAKSIP